MSADDGAAEKAGGLCITTSASGVPTSRVPIWFSFRVAQDHRHHRCVSVLISNALTSGPARLPEEERGPIISPTFRAIGQKCLTSYDAGMQHQANT